MQDEATQPMDDPRMLRSGAAPSAAEAVAELPIALTVKEAASILRLSTRTVREMVRTGELAGNKRGHAIRISRSAVLAWLSGSSPSRAQGGRR